MAKIAGLIRRRYAEAERCKIVALLLLVSRKQTGDFWSCRFTKQSDDYR